VENSSHGLLHHKDRWPPDSISTMYFPNAGDMPGACREMGIPSSNPS